MQTYRLRADSINEVFELKRQLQQTIIEVVTYWDVPQVEVRFESDLAIIELYMIMASIKDSRLMINTLSSQENYTLDIGNAITEEDWEIIE